MIKKICNKNYRTKNKVTFRSRISQKNKVNDFKVENASEEFRIKFDFKSIEFEKKIEQFKD